jgi:hypothetical protein
MTANATSAVSSAMTVAAAPRQHRYIRLNRLTISIRDLALREGVAAGHLERNQLVSAQRRPASGDILGKHHDNWQLLGILQAWSTSAANASASHAHKTGSLKAQRAVPATTSP